MFEAQAVVAKVDSVGTLPTVASRVLSLVGDGGASLGDFEQVIRPDAGLTALLLRWANSARYRGVRPVTSIHDAVVRLGTKGVLEAACSSSFSRLIPKRLLGYELSADEFWGHGVAVAVVADRLGAEVGFARGDLAFTAGLLHDVGKAVLGACLSAGEASGWRHGQKLATIEDEQQALGTDHALVGDALLGRWGLGEEIRQVVRAHHDWYAAPTATMRFLAGAVHLADQLVHAGDEGRAVAEVLDSSGQGALLERLGVSAARLHRLVEDATDDIAAMRAMAA